MQNELNTMTVEAVKEVCNANFIALSKISVGWVSDYIEIRVSHPEIKNKTVCISTMDDSILVEIEVSHIHLPDYSDELCTKKTILSLKSHLQKYFSGSISSYIAMSTTLLGGGHFEGEINLVDIKKSFKNIEYVIIYNWHWHEPKTVSI